MRIGILGGTFDPPHVGHLLAASDAHDALKLDGVLFIPAAQQPLKTHLSNGPISKQQERAPAPDRLEMVRLAIAGDDRFDVSAIEINRGGLSYSVETLGELVESSPGDTWYFLIGADVLETFAKWREPETILRLATLAVFTRGIGDGDSAKASWDRFCAEWRATHGGTPEHAPVFLKSRRIDVSSTEVRERVAMGRSIHGFVPDAVAGFIAERGLYR